MQNIKRSFEKSTSEERMLQQENKKLQHPKSFSFHAITDETHAGKKRSLLRRLSPFLLLVFGLLVLFPYMMITGEGAINNIWWLVFLFPFTEVNLLLADFALWNYFRGKRIARIWLIELAFSVLIVSLLI